MNNLQYKGTIKYNIVANTEDSKIITSSNSTGGIIGILAKKLNYDDEIEQYNNVECNLIVTDIASNGSFISFGAGSITNSISGRTQSSYMNNIYVYNCSKIKNKQVGGITEEVAAYKMLSSNDLKNTATYTKNSKIQDEEGTIIGNEGLNFGTGRYEYTVGFFPILKQKYSNSASYWEASNLNVIQTKLPIPEREEEFDSNNTQSINTLGLNTLSTLALRNMQNIRLPEIYVYSTDVDKINIEFGDINSYTSMTISDEEGNIIVEKQNISDKVYTLMYDFKTTLDIKIENANYFETTKVSPQDVQNKLAILNDEYLYLTNQSIKSNKRSIDRRICKSI